MNIEKVTYKLVKDSIENGVISPFIMKMMIHTICIIKTFMMIVLKMNLVAMKLQYHIQN